MLARVRLAGVGTILALVLVVAYVGAQADWRVMVPVFATYVVGAALLAAAVRRSDRAAIGAGFAVALLDVPAGLRRAVAVGAGVAVTGRRGRVRAGDLRAAGPAEYAVAEPAADDAGRRRFGPRRGALAARGRNSPRRLGWRRSSCSAAPRRWLRTWSPACGRWWGDVGEEQRKRERLGRYFSPSVAERLQSQRDGEAKPEAQELTVLFSDIRDFTATSAALPAGRGGSDAQ